MKELSKEIINIDGVDYTLFLNRAGIVAFENYTKKEKRELSEISSKYQDISNEEIDFDKLDDNVNPFESINDLDDLDEDTKKISNIFKRLYWIMWYTEHKLSISEASDLYDKAVKEYGIDQIVQLGYQMIEEVNTDPNANLKNLAALKPKKK